MSESGQAVLSGVLSDARSALVRAELTEAPAERWLGAYGAALKVAAEVLRANAPSRSRTGRINAWRLLADVAPGLGEWASYFHALQGKRDVVAAGATALVSVREADDLVRDVELFTDTVAQRFARGRARWHGHG